MGPIRQTPLAELARAQHGVVSHAQLRALGWTRERVKSARRRGQLVGVERGVYAVGHHPAGVRTRWMAAVLALGEGAVLSHVSAAMAYGWIAPAGIPAHVTSPRQGRPRPTIVSHESRSLSGADRTVRDNIPLTAIPRTAIDLADVLPPARYARAIESIGILDVPSFARAIRRHPGRRATPALTRLLQLHGDRTRSHLERAFLALVRRHGLPRPLVNERTEGRERDFTWPGERLVVEVDGGAFHASRDRRAADNRRDLALTLAGWRHHRFTYEQVVLDPDETAHAVRALLGLSACR
jgi:very-short-patch-repair endonuclease/predicted transcriptional regulator of viral defense system